MIKNITTSLILLILATKSIAQTNTFPDSGDVGVGTTIPKTKLHVLNGNSIGIKTTYSDLLIENVDSHLDLVSSSLGTWGSAINFVEGNGTANTNVWSIARQTTNGDGNSGLLFNFGTKNQHNNANIFSLLPSGNVGIGTTTPDSKLTVNGNIRAKEVKVEATNWPDYVFEEEYKLLPLLEVRKFIQTNSHLPGFKSAAEYEQEGVNMLELNQKLVEKIEELTLYLIDTHQRIQELEKLEEKVRAIEDKLTKL